MTSCKCKQQIRELKIVIVSLIIELWLFFCVIWHRGNLIDDLYQQIDTLQDDNIELESMLSNCLTDYAPAKVRKD